MSVKVMAAVFDSSLPPNEKFVLLAYADHASDDGKRVYPAVDTIAKKTSYSARTVQRITRQLEEAGFLIPDGKGKKGTNRWRIPIDVGGVNLSPLTSEVVKGDIDDQGGDIGDTKSAQMSPEPSITIIKPSEEGPKEKPSNNKYSHPPNHPSIQIFREVMGKWPDKEDGRPMIIDAIGDGPKKLASWKQHLIGWKLSGYNRLNIAGIVDAFLAGGLRAYGEEAPVKSKTREFLDGLRESEDV
jgi:hypothetical protein